MRSPPVPCTSATIRPSTDAVAEARLRLVTPLLNPCSSMCSSDAMDKKSGGQISRWLGQPSSTP